MMQALPGLSPLAARHDALLLDLWGVIHDGTALYPGVHNALKNLRRAGKKIIFVSNAPRRAWKVETVLTRLGIGPELYDHVISSGETGYQWFASGGSPWGRRFFYIGPEGTTAWSDTDIMDGLDYERAPSVNAADFLLNVGFGSERENAEDMTPLLHEARALSLPMLCLNPDLEVVKITGERYPCAGVIAQAYDKLGGEVRSFGKPYPAIYEHCFAWLAPLEKNRILAVGDSLETDIAGAAKAGIDSVLVTGGILNGHTPQEIQKLCKTLNTTPTYTMQGFTW